MNLEEKLAWADAHDITSVRLFNVLDRRGFFDHTPTIWAGYDFLLDARAGKVRNIGRKTLREFETALGIMLCESFPREAWVKTRKEYTEECVRADATIYQRHDTLMVLWERGALTPDEENELHFLCELLYPSLPPWES